MARIGLGTRISSPFTWQGINCYNGGYFQAPTLLSRRKVIDTDLNYNRKLEFTSLIAFDLWWVPSLQKLDMNKYWIYKSFSLFVPRVSTLHSSLCSYLILLLASGHQHSIHSSTVERRKPRTIFCNSAQFFSLFISIPLRWKRNMTGLFILKTFKSKLNFVWIKLTIFLLFN